jgi:hypothetical protein
MAAFDDSETALSGLEPFSRYMQLPLVGVR